MCKKSLLDTLNRGEAPENTELYGTVTYRKGAPLLTFVSRLGAQKGMDVLVDALEELMAQHPDVQLIGLGSGDPMIEGRFRGLADHFSGRVCRGVRV